MTLVELLGFSFSALLPHLTPFPCVDFFNTEADDPGGEGLRIRV
jgi:hypothetical protein